MAFGDTASSQGYSAAAGAEAGSLINLAGAGIYFGAATIGATNLTSTPTITPSSSASPIAAQGGSSVPGTANATGAPALVNGGSVLSSPLILILIVIAGGFVVYEILHRK